MSVSFPRYPQYTTVRALQPLAINVPSSPAAWFTSAHPKFEYLYCEDVINLLHGLEDVLLLIRSAALDLSGPVGPPFKSSSPPPFASSSAPQPRNSYPIPPAHPKHHPCHPCPPTMQTILGFRTIKRPAPAIAARRTVSASPPLSSSTSPCASSSTRRPTRAPLRKN